MRCCDVGFEELAVARIHKKFVEAFNDCMKETVMYRPLSDSTLKRLTKEQLIGHLRCAENNWQNEKQRAEILSKRLIQLTDKLIESDVYMIKEINKMLTLREYGED